MREKYHYHYYCGETPGYPEEIPYHTTGVVYPYGAEPDCKSGAIIAH